MKKNILGLLLMAATLFVILPLSADAVSAATTEKTVAASSKSTVLTQRRHRRHRRHHRHHRRHRRGMMKKAS